MYKLNGGRSQNYSNELLSDRPILRLDMPTYVFISVISRSLNGLFVMIPVEQEKEPRFYSYCQRTGSFYWHYLCAWGDWKKGYAVDRLLE